ncbi:Probable GTP-binding protein OBGM, mitochondrial,GTP-binding protein 10 homolog,GTP-binding protein 10,GTPase Obg [Acanthosepion pharaonis]|uniref:Probable GTP-binding protein OBGM, mitochondrial,GTP-binding protein 10 homolog,GTP-binding protein 10,GTPase Obg n=1 Tax=Acanthosepion pharaonis TaxID=158019 RepID=A0A812BZ95_ACAPH|nr:Probable GTP-binding protein OBGM, mitochondrial,GTP-binding protein 10 homolog,GTP-binding protein 10,GTPase Obg [Sepia pharaonis]
MVWLSRVFCYYIPNKSKILHQSGFIDTLRVYLKSGAGGQGLPRLGGIGGNGGDIYFQANEKLTLKNMKQKNPSKRYFSETGKDSSKRLIIGKNGGPLEIQVPVGVTIETDSGRVLGELNTPNEKILMIRGGLGGHIDNRFLGQKGKANHVKLVLKLIADIGLVGFPNAGKSTLLRALSFAKPRVAPLPFTTIHPEIGMMEYPDKRQIKVADLPGLIEGSHMNLGMGHKFLRHVERTKLLLFVVDVHGFQLGLEKSKRTAFETLILLNKELELYQPELLSKPAILVLNKVESKKDQETAEYILEKVRKLPDSVKEVEEYMLSNEYVQFEHMMTISAKKKINTSKLKDKLREYLDYYSEQRRLLEMEDTMASRDDRTLNF